MSGSIKVICHVMAPPHHMSGKSARLIRDSRVTLMMAVFHMFVCDLTGRWVTLTLYSNSPYLAFISSVYIHNKMLITHYNKVLG